MNKTEMMQIVYNQLAIDYNCNCEDFCNDEIIFTEAIKLDGRRALPFIEPRLEIVTFGRGLIINSSSSIIRYVKNEFRNKSKLEIINSSLVKSFNPYYLPDIENFKCVNNDFCKYEIINTDEIIDYYKFKNLHNALQYDKNSKRPEVLGIVAYKNSNLAGIACASKDSNTMWQIGVDVVAEYRGNGVAVALVNKLAEECFKRNVVPYYTTDIGNINSQKIAIRSGFIPAWSHCFRTRVKNNALTKTILSKI